MRKIIRKIGTGVGIALLVMLIAAVVIAAFFQDAVGKKLIAELNKQLTTELTVDGFELSLLRGFPNATVRFHDVLVKGRFGEGLLEAREVAFRFRLLSLFGSQIKIHSVVVSDGALNVHLDNRGRANYDIFKTQAENGGQFNISLKKARLENIELAFRDDQLRQEMLMQVEEADFSGRLSSKKYDLKSKARLVSNFIDSDGVRYFAGKTWGYDANISVDVEKGEYDFNKVKVLIEDNLFNLAGKINKKNGYTDIDLLATADDADIASVIALLPKEQLELLGGFSSEGTFHFSMDIIGRLSSTQSPAMEATLSLQNGRLTHPLLKGPLKDVSFDAVFTNGEGHSLATSSFEIKKFKGYLHRELLTLHLKIEDFDDPFIDFQMDGALPVEYVYGFFGHPGITGGDGEIEINNLDVAGLYRDMLSVRHVPNVEMKGALEFDDAAIEIIGENIILDRGKLIFDNNELSLQDLRIEGAGSDIVLHATASNLLPVLFADSLNSNNARLLFSGRMNASKLDLSKWRKVADVPMKENAVGHSVYDSLKTEKYAHRARLTDLIQGSFKVNVDRFTYNIIEGKNFMGNLSIENSQAHINGAAEAMDGQFTLGGVAYFTKEPYVKMKLSGDGIDVRKFFYQTENLGQNVVRHENLEGTMNINMLVEAYWDSTGQFLYDKLHAWSGFGIKKGELKNLDILETFSSYVKVRDLRHIRFEDMQNWVEIKNSKFYLPVMFLQNNAMNMLVSGEQTFEGKIDYGIKINAGQVLVNKLKSGSNQKPIKAKKDGFFNLYYNVYGTLDDYKYETNRRKVKDMFRRSEKQKQQIRAVLIKEFGAPLHMLRHPALWPDDNDEVAGWDDDDVEYIEGF